MDFLQLFLIFNVLLLGISGTIAVQHAYSHFLHKRHPEKDHAAMKDSPLPPKLKEQLLKKARTDFQDALDASADSLRHDLKATSDRVNLHLEELGNDIIHKEMERYHQRLEQLYGNADKEVKEAAADVSAFIGEHRQHLGVLSEQAGVVIGQANTDIETYKQELKAKLDQLYGEADAAISGVGAEISQHTQELKQQLSKDVAAEKEQLLAQFDAKLADAVAAFLVETLQHEVDLGAQAEYLTAMLEEHKDELVKGVKDEA